MYCNSLKKNVCVWALIFGISFFVFTSESVQALELPAVVLDSGTSSLGGQPSTNIRFNGSYYTVINIPEYGAELWKTDGTGVGTVLVKDIVIGDSTTFLFMGTTTDYLFFRGFTREYGTELWLTDGTAEGTRMVKDIRPGSVGGVSSSVNTVIGSTMYFIANDGTNGLELWKSDGTSDGTVMVANVWSGSSSGYVSGQVRSVGNNIFFFGNDDGAGGSVIRSDGTALGTYSLGTYPALTTNLTAIGSYIYTGGDDGTNGRELWRIDGNTLVAEQLKDINPGSANSLPSNFVSLDSSIVLFIATHVASGTELWRTDGTALGTTIVKDINPGAGNGSVAMTLSKIGSSVIISADDGTSGSELWKTDGTEVGTVMIKDINPGAGGSSFSHLGLYNNEVYFSASDGSSGAELWKTDGTTLGTVLVKDIYPGIASSSPAGAFVFNGFLYFTAWDGVNGVELWKTDGTTGGTVMVKDFLGTNGISSASIVAPSNNSELIFRMATSSSDSEIWKTDGTSGGTSLVKDIFVGITGSGNTGSMIKIGNTTYFVATDASAGSELWKTDGTTGGTVMVKDIRPGSTGSGSGNFNKLGSNLIFTASDGTNGNELWISDGTSVGTVMLKDIRAGSNSSQAGTFMVSTSSILFSANDGIYGTNLWRTDGTVDGTYVVDNAAETPVQVISTAADMNFAIGSTAAYFYGTGADGSALWRSDGTLARTFAIKDFYVPDDESILDIAVTGNNTAFIIANENISGDDYKLWKSDGTVDGTVFVKDLNGLSPITGLETNSSYDQLTAGDTKVYFEVETQDSGFELWISDGTSAGTYMIKDIYPGSANGIPGGPLYSSIVQALAVVGDVAYFQGMDETNGAELWKTDGTEEGTYVLDIFPGSGSSAPANLLVTNNETELYMTAVSPGIGRELMRLPLTSTTTLSSITTSSISKTGATVSTSITDVGFARATERGFNYGTSLAYGSGTSTTGLYSLSTFEYDMPDLTCNTTYYVQAFAVNTYGTTTQTTSFTTSACDAVVTPSSSRRGGGGSRISVPVTPTSTTPLPTLVVPPTSSSNTTTFTRDLSFGSTGTDVIALQRFLNSRGFTVSTTGPGSPGNEINVFGSRTQAALARFQTSVGITPASGYFGPITRSFVNALGTPVQTPTVSTPTPPTTPTAPQTTTSPSNNTTTYTRDLFLGSRGSDVTSLQNFLIQQGYLESGFATGYFGQLTQAALIKFQQANDISPALGYFGAKTRGVVGK